MPRLATRVSFSIVRARLHAPRRSMVDSTIQRGTTASRCLGLVLVAILCTLASCQHRWLLPEPGVIFNVSSGSRDSIGQDVEFDGFAARSLSLLQTRYYNLAFVNFSSGLYILSILANSSNSSLARVVWEANRDNPVRANASLVRAEDGALVLVDSDRRSVWSTPVRSTPANGSFSLELQETGKLVIVDMSNSVLWESFGSPTDTLLLNQVLGRGMKLASRPSSANFSSGFYNLVVEPGGMVLYSNLSGGLEPYWISDYYGINTLSSVRTTCQFFVEAVLNGSSQDIAFGMSLMNESANSSSRDSSLCSRNPAEPIIIRRTGNSPENQTFIRLEADGNLRAYTLTSSGDWNESYQLFGPADSLFHPADSCGLPAKCQPFGTCLNGACVDCLQSNGTRSPWGANTCSAPLIESCSNTSSLGFVAIPGVEHFSSRYLNGSSLTTRFEDCESRCLQNCSCTAFFFWNESSSCFLTTGRDALQRVPDHRHGAYIKAALTRDDVSTREGMSDEGSLSAGATAGIVVGSLFLVLVVCLPVMLCIRRDKQSNKVDAVSYRSENYLESMERLKPMRFYREDLEQITDNFSKLIGSGGFGSVYEGSLPDGRKVAVKKLDSTGDDKRQFFAEVAVLGTFRHWNLVRLLGFCDQGHGFIVNEYAANGSLDRWIYRDSTESLLHWELRMGVVMGTARALAYLHEERMEVHLNVKPRNVLVDASFVAKLADYGLSRLIAINGDTATRALQESYLAPEWLLDTSVTEKCDVYSFGVLLLEVMSGQRSSESRDRFHLPAKALELALQGREMELVDPRIAKETNESKVRQGVQIALQCLLEDPRSRPSMGNVVRMLEGSCEVLRVSGSSSAFPWLKSDRASTPSSSDSLVPH